MSGHFDWLKNKRKAKVNKENAGASGAKPGKKEKGGKKEGKLTELLDKDAQRVKKEMGQKNLLWFHGNINRRLAETRLKKGGNKCGMFLVRGNNLENGDYVLSFVHKEDNYGHYIITQKADFRYSIGEEEPIEGVDKLLEHYRTTKCGGLVSITVPVPDSPPPALCLHQGFTNVLHQTIEREDSVEALKILEHKACPDINSKDSNGNSTLHLAVKHNLIDVVKKLVQLSVSLSMCDADGFTALHRACQQGRAEVVSALVGAGADVQYRHRATENVALHEAAAAGHHACVQILLDNGAAAWTRNGMLRTPYELAIKFSHHQCAQILDQFKPKSPISNKKDWYHERLSRQEATSLMEKHRFRDGIFLVRKSSRNPNNYVLTLSFNAACRHYEIIQEKNIAFHIDNGPLLSSLAHLVDYYARYSDGLECRLLTAITPGGALKMLITNIGDFDDSEDQLIYGVHENGGTCYMEVKELRRGSIPNMPPPPPPIPPPSSLFTGSGKHPVILPPESIELGFELGQGEYGSVLRGLWTSNNGEQVDVAIKTMNEEGMENGKKQFLQEAEVMVKLNHPCIVSLIGVSEGPPLMLVQELVELGALLDYLLDYPEQISMATDLVLWAAQVACGMLYLETQGFVHRDLAARNILLANKMQAKVGDFGLSRSVTGNQYTAHVGGRWPVKWYAPEAINYGHFSHKSDVWSFGVTLWEMYTLGDQPYGEMKGAQVIAFLERGGRLERPKKCPEVIYDIMRDCWQMEAEQRPDFRWLLNYFNRDIESGSLRIATSTGNSCA